MERRFTAGRNLLKLAFVVGPTVATMFQQTVRVGAL